VSLDLPAAPEAARKNTREEEADLNSCWRNSRLVFDNDVILKSDKN
jgi:hypothetical protein